MNLTVRQLEALAAIAGTGSFSLAARKLFVTQPALSEMVKRIEEEIGARLFDRTTRSLSLTPEGTSIVAIARSAVQDFNLALENIADHAEGRRGQITIATLPSLACTVLPVAVMNFKKRYPFIMIRVHDVLHERAVNMVLDGVANVALTVNPMRQLDIAFEPLGADEMEVVLPLGHALATRDRLSWTDFLAYPFIALTQASSVRALTDAAFVHLGVTHHPAYEVEQIPSAAGLAAANLGLTALPNLTRNMYDKSGLTTRRLHDMPMRRQFGAITLTKRPRKPGTDELIAEFFKAFGSVANRSQD